MNWPLRWLQLPPDADATAIKRSYAKRLRLHRPDTDPDGFQQLHAAYQAALAWARTRDADADVEDVEDEDARAAARTATFAASPGASDGDDRRDAQPTPAAAPATHRDVLDDQRPHPDTEGHAPPPTQQHPLTPAPQLGGATAPTFDPDALCDDLLALATQAEPQALQHWLQRQPALWSLGDKAQIGWRLSHRLQQRLPPIQRDNLAILLDCFGLDDIAAGPAAHALPMLQERLHLAWEMQPQNAEALARRVYPASHHGDRVPALMRQLTRPFALPQALWASLLPGRPSALRRLLMRLDQGRVDDLPAPVDRQQIDFWMRASEAGYLTRARLSVGLLRCAATALLVTIVVLLASAASAWSPDPVPMSLALTRSGLAALAIVALWMGWLLAGTLLRWQGEAESDNRSPAPHWRRWAFVPLLAGIGLGMSEIPGQQLAGGVIATIALLSSVVRLWRRSERPYRPNSVMLWLAFLAPSMAQSLPVALSAALALGLWTWDLLRHHRLRWRRS
ncbi:molecular chaperone DnaJ [Xanthomonas graminis]|uniref:Putative membrane protein n=1 Tax=Xanthomonas graminis pv. phlei TaxID=487906 RepID=A0A0K2ZGV2_9XANT|nr:molecular chaperone DnaJ [Xanthomonas translucens]UKE64715.1 J domain-containing protein [Xanthomonas translucens pv. phlei]CTP82585.1 putative membrane protein [Xanthomonas translucens pv. phlei]